MPYTDCTLLDLEDQSHTRSSHKKEVRVSLAIRLSMLKFDSIPCGLLTCFLDSSVSKISSFGGGAGDKASEWSYGLVSSIPNIFL